MKHWIWIALAAAALGCETTSSVSPSPTARPSGAWALEAFELSGGQVIPVADKGSYTLEFVSEERLSIRADCNRCNGGYSLTDGTFEIGLLACTLAACPPGSLDGRYVSALDSAAKLEQEGQTLRIVYDEGTLRFVRMSAP